MIGMTKLQNLKTVSTISQLANLLGNISFTEKQSTLKHAHPAP